VYDVTGDLPGSDNRSTEIFSKTFAHESVNDWIKSTEITKKDDFFNLIFQRFPRK